jgi:prophage regulatory protein
MTQNSEAVFATPTTNLKFIRLKDLIKSISMSRSTAYERMNPKSKYYDPRFPKPISLGSCSSAIGFVESEVQEYIAHLIASSRKVIELPNKSSNQNILSVSKSASSRDVAIPSKEKLA